MSSTVLGFVGLGSMGSAMAPRLASAGHSVIGFDQSAEAGKSLIEAGGEMAGSVAEVGERCDIVFLSLPTPQIVHDVALGEGGVAAGSPRIIVDLSTTGPRMSAQIAEQLNEAGIILADAPVSGGRPGALAGTLALMVACPTPVWEEIEPLLANLGKTFHVGEEAGQGQMMKLINNIMSVSALAITSEGMALGVKAGLDPKLMLDVINVSSGRNSATVDKFPRSVLTRGFDYGFATGLSLKDVRLCLDEAEALGVPMPTGTAARTMLNFTNARYGPESDFTCMAKIAEQWAGVEIG